MSHDLVLVEMTCLRIQKTMRRFDLRGIKIQRYKEQVTISIQQCPERGDRVICLFTLFAVFLRCKSVVVNLQASGHAYLKAFRSPCGE